MPRSDARSSVSRSLGVDAHDMRHHHPDRARDLVAIGQQIFFGGRRPAGRVAGEAGEMVVGQVGGDARFRRDRGQAVERDEPGRLPGKRGIGLRAKEGDALGGIVGAARRGRASGRR